MSDSVETRQRLLHIPSDVDFALKLVSATQNYRPRGQIFNEAAHEWLEGGHKFYETGLKNDIQFLLRARSDTDRAMRIVSAEDDRAVNSAYGSAILQWLHVHTDNTRLITLELESRQTDFADRLALLTREC